MFPSFEDRARSSMARERVAQRDAELAEARAEVERLQALVQQMSEATTVQACRGCGQYVRPRYMADGLCATCWRAKVDGYRQECDEVEQALGRALGYPGYPELDSPRVCVGDHAPATIAAEAARKLYHLRALTGWQHEALELWAAIPDPERTRVRCAYCAVSVPANRLLEHTAACVLADPDGQRAAEEWAALLKVAETAQAWEDVRKAYVFGAPEVMEAEAWLCVALDGLRAVRDGKEEKDGHGPCEGD